MCHTAYYRWMAMCWSIMIINLYYTCVHLRLVNIFKRKLFGNVPPTPNQMQQSHAEHQNNMAPVSMASGKVKTFRLKWLRRQMVQVICHAYNQIEKEIKARHMRGSTAACTAKCHVIVTWEVLQAFLRIATIVVVSTPNVWQTINKLLTQDLELWAFRVFCNSTRGVNWSKFHLHIMFGSWVVISLLVSSECARCIAFCRSSSTHA